MGEVNAVDPLPEQPTRSAAGAAGASSASVSSAAAAASASVDLSWQREDHLLSQSSRVGPPVQYGEVHFRAMGKALLVALLDLLPPGEDGLPANPYSRLPASELQDLAGADKWARQWTLQPPKRLMKKLGAKRGMAAAAAADK